MNFKEKRNNLVFKKLQSEFFNTQNGASSHLSYGITLWLLTYSIRMNNNEQKS